MKKFFILLVLLGFGLTQAQNIQYRTSDFNLPGDVTKYEEKEFFFDHSKGKYQLVSTRTIFFSKGLVTKIDYMSNFFLYVTGTNTYTYKDNILQSINYKTSLDESTDVFTYKNGKISEKNCKEKEEQTTYKYDNSGRLIEESEFKGWKAVKKATYSYASNSNYLVKTIAYNSNNQQDINEKKFEGSVLVEEKNTTAYSTLIEKYKYDSYKNQIEYNREGVIFKNEYQYDKKGTIIKSLISMPNYEMTDSEKYFKFAKVTYGNGKEEGDSGFDVSFVKKFEPNSSSYEVSYTFEEASTEELFDALENLKSEYGYKIKKGENNTFFLVDAEGEEITNDVAAVRTKNGILIYDELYNTNIVLKNFYEDEVKINEWYAMDYLISETGLYWFFSDSPEFFIIKDGKFQDMTKFKLVKTEKEDDFIIQENGVNTYMIRNLNSKSFETFYAVELLNK